MSRLLPRQPVDFYATPRYNATENSNTQTPTPPMVQPKVLCLSDELKGVLRGERRETVLRYTKFSTVERL